MKKTSLAFVAFASGLCLAQPAFAVDIAVDQDMMASPCFSTPNTVRGHARDNRPVMRASTKGVFGLPGAETIYRTFDYDVSTFSGPVLATLTMQSTAGGQNQDAGPGTPFTASAHGMDADPPRFGQAGFNIRGVDGDRVAMESDGVRLPDEFKTGGCANAGRNLVDVRLLKAIEIQRGSGSVLSGSGALGAAETMLRSLAARGSGLSQRFRPERGFERMRAEAG